MRVVLDANVLASAFINPAVPAQIMHSFARGEFELFLSQHIVRSLERAWGKPYFRQKLSDERQRETINWLQSAAVMVIPASGIHGVAEDDEDDLVIATAVAAKADVLVSGDKYLQRVGSFQGIPIMSPREFLAALEEPTGPDQDE